MPLPTSLSRDENKTSESSNNSTISREKSLIAASQSIYKSQDVVQVNIPAESGEMGVLAMHVPSIEQLKPGLVEVIEESGGSKQFFRASGLTRSWRGWIANNRQCLAASPSFSPTR